MCLGALAFAVHGETRISYPQVDADARLELARAVAVAESLRTAADAAGDPGAIEPQTAIALGYLERLRLGLGSPFRLIDQARQDPRLTASLRRSTAWALMAYTLTGASYEIGPAALDATAFAGVDSASGAVHLRLIDSAITRADDPRSGELAVRIAYALARAEHSVSAAAVPLSAQAAALLRDRELARRDAVELLDAARTSRLDPLLLVAAWRADRRFAVERPALADQPRASAEAAAVAQGAALAAELREIDDAARTAAHAADAARRDSALRESEHRDSVRRDSAALAARGSGRAPGGPAAAVADVPVAGTARRAPPAVISKAEYARTLMADVRAPHVGAGWLGLAAARRLGSLTSVRGAPPQAAVVTAARQHRARLFVRADSVDAATAERRARFVERVRNEETLVAEQAIAAAELPGRGAPAVVLAAAVALRAYAQEPVWFPGFPAPTVAELKQQFGLASVSFDRDVPAAWRPFYLRMLATSLDDIGRVLPALTLRGAGVHFGESVLRDSALALHDPVTRTIFLPVGTSAGAIAHEIAHDLDWQVARSRRGVRGDYLTDRVVREGRGRLAAAIGGLTTGQLAVPSSTSGVPPHATQRPTEVFARSVDYFVAAALAREGRVNGYLSTVQDELLTGYTLVVAPDPAGRAGQSLAEALDDLTELPAPLRAWYVDRYGVGRDLDAYARLRAVLALPRFARMGGTPGLAPPAALDAALPGPTVEGVQLLERVRGEAPTLATRAACRTGDRERAAHRSTLARVVALGTAARVRGAERDGAWWGGGAGPWHPDLSAQRTAEREARLVTRVRAADAASDPLAHWLVTRGGGCEGR